MTCNVFDGMVNPTHSLHNVIQIFKGLFDLQMQAVDRDSGMNGQLSFSVIYQSKSRHAFDVRPDSANPSIAILYSRYSFDREGSDYGAFTYEGRVTLKVKEIK